MKQGRSLPRRDTICFHNTPKNGRRWFDGSKCFKRSPSKRNFSSSRDIIPNLWKNLLVSTHSRFLHTILSTHRYLLPSCEGSLICSSRRRRIDTSLTFSPHSANLSMPKSRVCLLYHIQLPPDEYRSNTYLDILFQSFLIYYIRKNKCVWIHHHHEWMNEWIII